jgi:serine/threonine protein kinase
VIVFLKCVAEAVVENGLKGLAGMVPGGEFAYEVAKATLDKYRQRRKDTEAKAEIEALAQASFEQAKQAAIQAAKEVAAGVAPDDLVTLEQYLAQVPASVQQSLKRSDDPSGKTAPATFALNTPDDVLKLLPPRPPRFRPGDPLPGKPGWVLERPLGTGGFGEVWLARHPRIGSLAGAVKFCRDLSAKDRSLLHEGGVINRVMGAGRHPNIVPLLDADLDGSAPWLMYEYVEGGDLADWVRGLHRRSREERVPQALTGFRQLAAAVGHFHRLSPAVVHRDLKPSNILLDRTNKRLRITDFGIGAVAARSALNAEADGATTRGGQLLSCLRGSYTPLYSSPQQRAGAPPDPRDDVHALGVIGYQLLTGHLTQGAGPDFADDLRDAGAGPELIALLGACVAQRPDRRPTDAVALADQLAKLAPGSRPPAAQPVPVAPQYPVPVTPAGVPAAPTRALPTSTPGPQPALATKPSPPGPTSGEWDIGVPGQWFSRSAGDPDARWKKVFKTPARVTGTAGVLYCLEIAKSATDRHLTLLDRLAGLTTLYRVAAEGCRKLTAVGFNAIARLTQLGELELAQTAADDQSLADLRRIAGLSYLGLGGTAVTSSGLRHLAGLSGLRFLGLQETAVGDDGLTWLEPLGRIEELHLGKTKVTDQGLTRFIRLPLLSLNLDVTRITDAGLLLIGEFRKLTRLSLSATRITGAGLAHLSGLSALRELFLDNTAIGDMGIARLSRLHSLEALSLWGCHGVTDGGLRYLSGLPRLNTIVLNDTPVTDTGLDTLSGCQGLQWLALNSCPNVTDVGLTALSRLSSLKYLGVTGTKVTGVGVQRFREAVPKCRVDLGR